VVVSTIENPRRSAGRAIVAAGLLCGVLDIASAIVISLSSSGPIHMLQGIAGAILGPAAFRGGAVTAALGLAMHFCVAFSAASIFYLLSRRFPVLVESPVVGGFAFGIFWLFVMYRGVVPLSAAFRTLYLTNVKRTLPALWPLPILVHMTCVGLPIALAVRRFGPVPGGAEPGDRPPR
jgi:hypothetical protein